jgi:hypothetical protein
VEDGPLLRIKFLGEKNSMILRCLLFVLLLLCGFIDSIFAASLPYSKAWLNRDDISQVRYVTSNAPILCKGEIAFPERTVFEERTMNSFLLEDFKHTRSFNRNFLSAEIFIRFLDKTSKRISVISQAICIDTDGGDLCLRKLQSKACFVSSAPHAKTEELMKRLGFEALVTDDEEGGMHSEEGLLSGLLENIHLYTYCVPRKEDRIAIQVQGIGLRVYSAYDACDGCLQDLSDARQEILKSFKSKCDFKNISSDLTCDIIFHSYHPYTRDGIDDEDDRMARYNLWLPGNKPKVVIHSIKPNYSSEEEKAPTAFIEGRNTYQLQFNQTGEIGIWQIPFSCIMLNTYGFSWQDIDALDEKSHTKTTSSKKFSKPSPHMAGAILQNPRDYRESREASSFTAQRPRLDGHNHKFTGGRAKTPDVSEHRRKFIKKGEGRASSSSSSAGKLEKIIRF